ncbi:MAG TPA: hypothetical protein DC060_10120, partial [Gemmatimonadetes bacterium]|nr:hypothetical protein [Gemmatimonadota bacterium]
MLFRLPRQWRGRRCGSCDHPGGRGIDHDHLGAGCLLGRDASKVSIELFDVEKAFGKTQVLNRLTLTIHEGQTVSIIGGSGSGKSTALKHMVGLLRPDDGEVYVDEQNVSRL